MSEIDDDLPVSDVGEWALQKHDILRRYINASRYARRRFVDPSKSKQRNASRSVGGATYVELFCGPGLCRMRETGSLTDGSPLVAYKTAREGGVPFSEIHLADFNSSFSSAAVARISALGGKAFDYTGPAESTAKQIVSRLNPDGLHFAFLDPWNLGGLEFGIIRALSTLRYVDLLLHVSVSDLQRNSDRYTDEEYNQFDLFAPGWRSKVSLSQNLEGIRRAILGYWWDQVRSLNFLDMRDAELIRGSKNQRLYWLVFVSRNKIANHLWDQIKSPSGQRKLL